jgi:hypothetical protein
MKITLEGEKTIIDLDGKRSGLIRLLSFFNGIGLLVAFIFLLVTFLFFVLPMGIEGFDGGWVFLTSLAMAIVFFLAAWQSLKNWVKETLVFEKDGLTLQITRFGGMESQTVRWNEIQSIQMASEVKPFEHDLNTKPFDYLGIQSRQDLINGIFTEGKIELKSTEGIFLFGRQLYSWDLDELLLLMKEKSGIDFQKKPQTDESGKMQEMDSEANPE